jgi:hypothetical protein
MTTQRLPHPVLPFGTLPVLKPLLWASAGAAAFVLFSNGPAWFAEQVATQSSAVSLAAFLPAAGVISEYVSSDPSLPSASSVFAGRFYEASQQMDTF